MFNYDKQKVDEIHFKSKYISGQALNELTDFSKNSYIIKGSTGIGGTTALLNYTNGNCIIVSPNVGMIKSKAKGNYKSDKQFFIYSQSPDNWNNVKDQFAICNNVIINCTPEQIIYIRTKDKEFYNRLITVPIFIDEAHAYTAESNYRKSLGEFMELVYKEWQANFKLSTATPNYGLIDVPIDKDIKLYKISRQNEPTKSLQLSYNLKDAKDFIKSEIDKKRLVICFTNDINYHKSFPRYNVKNLVGKNLDTKLKPYKRGLKLDKSLYQSSIIFLSSSYFAGFDITKKCSICIISEQSNEAYKICVNNIAQAYGRCRNGVYKALFVNAKSKKDINGNPTHYPISGNEVNILIDNSYSDIKYWQNKVDKQLFKNEFINNDEVTSHGYVNRAFLMNSTLLRVNDYQLYNDSVLRQSLGAYNFILSEYSSKHLYIPRSIHSQFKSRLKNLLSNNEITLYNTYFHIKNNLRFKDEGVFSKKLALEYLTAYLLKKSNAKKIIEKLDNKRVKPNEFYNSMDLYLRANADTTYLFNQIKPDELTKANEIYYDYVAQYELEALQHLVNDWQILYACHRVSNNILPNQIEREIKLYELFYDVKLCKSFNRNKNRVRNVIRVILKRCVDLSIELNDNEYIWLDEVVKSIYKALDNDGEYTHSNSRKTIKNKMINALLFLLTGGKIVGEISEVKNREYNPLTQLPAKMRCIIPIKYVSIDLSSANAQIVDSILDTYQGLNVYQCLINNRDIDRQKAKKLYNSTLNNHLLTVSQAKRIYMAAGYSEVKALELSQMTAQVQKGAFYELMTANEKKLMENYSNILPIKSYRFHDAIVTPLSEIEKHNITLTTKVKGCQYHISLFNDDSDYIGRMSDIENNGEMLDNLIPS